MRFYKVRTAGELIAALEHFPKEMPVEIYYEGFARNWITCVEQTSEYGDGPVVEITVEEPDVDNSNATNLD